MNIELLFRMALASLIHSVKNPDKKAALRKLAQEAVQSLLLAYADDPTFLTDVE